LVANVKVKVKFTPKHVPKTIVFLGGTAVGA
jgi:hypothetical protein